MTTRKFLIVEKYTELTNFIVLHMGKDLLPNIEELDICDLVYFLTFYFIGIHEMSDFDIKIGETSGNEVSPEIRKKISPKIAEFIL